MASKVWDSKELYELVAQIDEWTETLNNLSCSMAEESKRLFNQQKGNAHQKELNFY